MGGSGLGKVNNIQDDYYTQNPPPWQPPAEQNKTPERAGFHDVHNHNSTMGADCCMGEDVQRQSLFISRPASAGLGEWEVGRAGSTNRQARLLPKGPVKNCPL